jgi:hypothetical protein
MRPEYKVVQGYGNHFDKRWELRRKYTYYAKARDIEPTVGWSLECCGTREFCLECLQHRLDRIRQGLEPTEYEQRRKETKANGFEMLPFMA